MFSHVHITYTCTHMHAHTYTCMHTHARMHTHTHTHVHTHATHTHTSKPVTTLQGNTMASQLVNIRNRILILYYLTHTLTHTHAHAHIHTQHTFRVIHTACMHVHTCSHKQMQLQNTWKFFIYTILKCMTFKILIP